MLTKVRHQHILTMLQEQKVVTVEELTQKLEASESTIRRDLNALDKMGKLNKVHGGATYIEERSSKEELVSVREQTCIKEKRAIGEYAASLLEENDFVYLDAGSTLRYMIEYISIQNITFVTNSIAHAIFLLKKGYRVFLIGGELKPVTEALIGESALHALRNYNFNKGFFGTNGIDVTAGFTTPEMSESAIKKEAMKHCQKCYVLADDTKHNHIAPITFAKIEDAVIITNKCDNHTLKTNTTVLEVEGS